MWSVLAVQFSVDTSLLTAFEVGLKSFIIMIIKLWNLDTVLPETEQLVQDFLN